MTFDLAADCERHPSDPRRGYSTVWMPNGSKMKWPHGSQTHRWEEMGVAMARGACDEWSAV